MPNNVRWFVLGVALFGCATHKGDDQPDPGTDAAHLEVVIDTPTLNWIDGVADTSTVHAIRVDDVDGTRTDVTDHGIGMAESLLFDERGVIGRAVQSLLLDRLVP